MDELEKQVEEGEILVDNIRAALNLGDVEQADRLLKQLKRQRALIEELIQKQIMRISRRAE